jgi:hypothetical protein
MSITDQQFQASTKRGKQLRAEYAASEAHYDRDSDRIVVSFPTGVQISVPPKHVQGLETATPAQLEVIELSPSGLALHFPAVDADMYIPALMHNVLGSPAWMSHVGRAGGAVRSERKAGAARENGKLGGRPKQS